eukprot:Clim_evm40s227 gene=Clim_evmTU40s227
MPVPQMLAKEAETSHSGEISMIRRKGKRRAPEPDEEEADDRMDQDTDDDPPTQSAAETDEAPMTLSEIREVLDTRDPENPLENARIAEKGLRALRQHFSAINTTSAAKKDFEALEAVVRNLLMTADRMGTGFTVMSHEGFRTNLQTILAAEDSLANRQRPGLNFVSIGRLALRFAGPTPRPSFVLGCTAKQARVYRVPQRRPREVHETAVTAAEGVNQEENNPSGTDNIAGEINRVLKRHKPDGCMLFSLVWNPENFGQTIENLFALSFLVKRGKVKIYNNADGLPMAANVKERADGATGEADSHATRKQFIWELDFRKWKAITEKFNIENGLLRNRSEAQQERIYRRTRRTT